MFSDMFSDNIIDRSHALSELVSLNFMNVYAVGVVLLLLVSWRLSKWL